MKKLTPMEIRKLKPIPWTEREDDWLKTKEDQALHDKLKKAHDKEKE
jgi:hypothetical protein